MARRLYDLDPINAEPVYLPDRALEKIKGEGGGALNEKW